MKYVSVEEARSLPGLRLALIAQTPSPWGLAARALFDLRKVDYVPVRQDAMQANEALQAWTGRRNAPVAVLDEEPPVDGWLEIANLAERLGSGPSLWPDDPVDRALAAGFSSEICGQGGFGWSRRLSMMGTNGARLGAIGAQYGLREDAIAGADTRVIGILRALTGQLKAQAAAGRDFLIADRISVCDVHWACFSLLVAPLPEDQCVMSDQMRQMFSAMPDALREAVDPALIAHRDRIWRDHIGLPLDYLSEDD